MSKLFTLIGEDFTPIRKGLYYTLKEHDSFIYDPEKDLFYWNSRNIVGDAITYLMQVRGMSYRNSQLVLGQTLSAIIENIRPERVSKPNPVLIDIFYKYGENSREYWYEKRGYDRYTVDFYKLGYTGDYWVIPIWAEGEFKNFQCRGYNDNGDKIVKSYYKGIGRLPWNFFMLEYTPTKCPIFVTESIVDAIMLWQNDHVAISSNAGSAGWDHEWSKDLLEFENVYIVYDNDEAGRNGAKRTSKFLQHNSSVLQWPSSFPDKYDLTDLYKDGQQIENLMEHFVPSYVLK